MLAVPSLIFRLVKTKVKEMWANFSLCVRTFHLEDPEVRTSWPELVLNPGCSGFQLIEVSSYLIYQHGTGKYITMSLIDWLEEHNMHWIGDTAITSQTALMLIWNSNEKMIALTVKEKREKCLEKLLFTEFNVWDFLDFITIDWRERLARSAFDSESWHFTHLSRNINRLTLRDSYNWRSVDVCCDWNICLSLGDYVCRCRNVDWSRDSICRRAYNHWCSDDVIRITVAIGCPSFSCRSVHDSAKDHVELIVKGKMIGRWHIKKPIASKISLD